MIFKKTFVTLAISMCLFVLCAACSSETPDNPADNNSTNDSAVTDSMDELKEDIKDAGDDIKDTGNDIKDTLTDDNTNDNMNTSGENSTQSSASNSQTAN